MMIIIYCFECWSFVLCDTLTYFGRITIDNADIALPTLPLNTKNRRKKNVYFIPGPRSPPREPLPD